MMIIIMGAKEWILKREKLYDPPLGVRYCASRTILFCEWARIKQPHYENGTHAMNQN